MSSVTYGVKSGIIVYKTTKDGKEFKTTHYFDQYGEVETIKTETELEGKKVNQVVISKDDYSYIYYEGQKEGEKRSNVRFPGLLDSERYNDSTIIKKGGKKLGTEKILGKECTVYELSFLGDKTKVWLWNNIVFKKETENTLVEIVEFKETSDFPAGIFDVPSNVEFKVPQHEGDDD
jgi:hypothetical protein